MTNLERVELTLWREFPGLKFLKPTPTPFQPVLAKDGLCPTSKLMACFTWNGHIWTAVVDMASPEGTVPGIEVQATLKYKAIP